MIKNILSLPLTIVGVNFWVNSKSYNLIEIVHLYLLLSIVDLLIGKKIYSASKKII